MIGERSRRGHAATAWSRWLAFLLACLSPCLPICRAPIQAAQPRTAATTVGATSSRAARDEAMRAIPWKRLTEPQRRQARSVVQNASMYRRLPTRVIDCDPDLFTFLAQHPEIVVDVWRVMGVSKVLLDRVDNGTYRGTDGAGTTGSVRFLYANWRPNADIVAVIYANGAYEGKPFVTPVKSQSVMLLRSSAVQETNGRHYVTVRVDSFVHIDPIGLELLAKTVRPWITKAADYNFVETMTFVSNFSRTAEMNPQGMQRLASRLTTVDEPTRDALVQLCYQTADRYAQREHARRLGQTRVGEPLLFADGRQ